MTPQQMTFIWDRLTTIGILLLVILLAMRGSPPSVGQAVVGTLIMGIILELLPYRRVAPDPRTLWNIRVRVAVVAVIGGFAFYILPRL
jgi:hypothetical protein